MRISTWRKSSHSGLNEACLEVADDVPGVVPVRDSKRTDGPTLSIPRDAWHAFTRLARR
ncbi:DUF397 domain-containing protein [Streptomyces alkaliphilus]|uniref:DUF397 domain-containing protein n=1 Tax=Streptomyces alkaliphilus TaxID=1472722 RepID=UPI0011809B2C|nr:DUF397 domain-containing protein [Streptomyces alkaliphilus]MQS08081.1 DUF397 domain-containing protein [Streptomyces alkaliphilus]